MRHTNYSLSKWIWENIEYICKGIAPQWLWIWPLLTYGNFKEKYMLYFALLKMLQPLGYISQKN